MDEELLLYMDNELSGAQKASVENEIKINKYLASQYFLLLQTKLDSSATIFYPNKKELYRHTEKVVYLPVWMRVAVAVLVLLFGAFFFIINLDKPASVGPAVAVTPKLNPTIKKNLAPEQKTIVTPEQKEEPVLAKVLVAKKSNPAILKTPLLQDKNKDQKNDVAVKDNDLADVDVESREYNGRWYTDVKAWKVEVTGGNTHSDPDSPAGEMIDNQEDGLPF